ncbi:MAG TPA: hypothetical protein VG245_02160 [Candidatus Dormibacteraeota bacterium]|jgi:hypothetical protein|nr:hypothetical protein [Candidatus Dormibacteraeota bacterium]
MKLNLARETLRDLTPAQMHTAAGGAHIPISPVSGESICVCATTDTQLSHCVGVCLTGNVCQIVG